MIAIEPALSQQAHQVNVGGRLTCHVYADRANWMSAADIALFAAACDALDGLEDGVIGNIVPKTASGWHWEYPAGAVMGVGVSTEVEIWVFSRFGLRTSQFQQGWVHAHSSFVDRILDD